MNRISTYRVKDIAEIWHVSRRTVRRWISDGLLKPRGYRRLGGSALELIFTDTELSEFMDQYLVKPEDLDIEKLPRGKEAKAAHVRRLIGTSRIFAGKASSAAMAKLLRFRGDL